MLQTEYGFSNQNKHPCTAFTPCLLHESLQHPSLICFQFLFSQPNVYRNRKNTQFFLQKIILGPFFPKFYVYGNSNMLIFWVNFFFGFRLPSEKLPIHAGTDPDGGQYEYRKKPENYKGFTFLQHFVVIILKGIATLVRFNWIYEKRVTTYFTTKPKNRSNGIIR